MSPRSRTRRSAWAATAGARAPYDRLAGSLARGANDANGIDVAFHACVRPTPELVPPAGSEFSFTEGGPLFRLEGRLGLLPRHHDELPLRLIVIAWLVTWLPLVLLAFPGYVRTSHWDPLLLRSEPHLRLLGALSLFLWAECLLEQRVRDVTRHLKHTYAIPRENVSVWQRSLERHAEIRDAWFPEAALLGSVYFLSFLGYLGDLPPWALRWLMPTLHSAGRHWELATQVTWWYLLVSQPFTIFLFIRWITRWLLFTQLMRRLAQLSPRVQPSHADAAGGLAFLAMPLLALRVFSAGAALTLTSVWQDELASSQAKPAIFANDILVFVVASLLFCLLPYLPFILPMLRAKERALLGYSALMNSYVTAFDKRWLDTTNEHADDLLGNDDFSGLADLGTSFRVAAEMHILIAGASELKAYGITTLVPFLFLIPVNADSTGELVRRVFMQVIGGA